MTKKTAYSVLLILLATAAWADTAHDQEAYCAYVLEEAQAQAIYLRSPSIDVGLTQQPIAAGVPQTYAGVTRHLSGMLKASAVKKAAGKDCELYRATIELQQNILYALPRIERDTLRARLASIERALGRLDHMISESQPLLVAQNLTISTLYGLRYERTRLEAQRAQTRLNLATVWVPEPGNEPLRSLLARKQTLEVEKQKAVQQVTRYDNWDVAITAGLHHNAQDFLSASLGGYGSLSLTYNLGAKARNRVLDQAAVAWGTWKQEQQSDSLQAAAVLRQQISDTIQVQEAALRTLRTESKDIEGTLTRVAGLETSGALSFGSRLEVDKLSLEIEIETAEYRLARLREYLAANF